jgi:hypothetical protein
MQQPTSSLGRLTVEVSDHTQLNTHPVGILRTSYQLVAEAATYTDNKRDERYALGGIRNRDPSNQAASDLSFWPHGHRDRQPISVIKLKMMRGVKHVLHLVEIKSL